MMNKETEEVMGKILKLSNWNKMQTICPKCKKHQQLRKDVVLRAVRLNEAKRFECMNCGYSVETLYKKQSKDTIVIFYAMSKVEKIKWKKN